MDLSKVIEGIPISKMFQTMFGKMVVTHEVKVCGVQYDSRKVQRDDLFVAIPGISTDGQKYIGRAVDKGAKVVIMEDDHALSDSYFMHAGVVKIVVTNARKALAIASANFYDHPSRSLMLVGVTGTNGKTTTTHLVKSILESRGDKVGLIGTIAHMAGEELIPASHTTPESLELHQLFGDMVKRGFTSAVMEVSSHSLALHRVHGLRFQAGVFTNLTQDHLDFHGSMQEYFHAKKSLFAMLGSDSVAITNADDKYGQSMIEGIEAPSITYGFRGNATIQARELQRDIAGTQINISYSGSSQIVSSPLIGRFNLQNILAAYATGVGLGIDQEVIGRGISRQGPVPGRFEQIPSVSGWTAIIDYAHTPDALDNCLRAIRELLSKPDARIITVFGCGGNRDKSKRPEMGSIAASQSDITIVTSDNPRTENPEKIIEDILQGIASKNNVQVEPNRRRAIHKALSLARQDDVVLIAGKGHEDYQIIGESKLHFDDREEVIRFLKESE